MIVMTVVLKVVRSWLKQVSGYAAGRKQWLPLASQLGAVWLFFAISPVLLVAGSPVAAVAAAGVAVAVAVTAAVVGMAARRSESGDDRLMGFMAGRRSDEDSR